MANDPAASFIDMPQQMQGSAELTDVTGAGDNQQQVAGLSELVGPKTTRVPNPQQTRA
jgi:hypothetical protein